MIELIKNLIQVFWLFLPAGFANMAPIIFKKINFLNKPINKQLFGANKTYRGFFFGILSAIIIVYIQISVSNYIPREYILISYTTTNAIFIGFLLGFGALFGDLIKSFFKRRKGIKSGEPWVIADQIDWIIGAVIFLNFYAPLSLSINIMAIIIFSIFHPLIRYVGYLLKIADKKL